MREQVEQATQQALALIEAYGYHAVGPALLADPAGVPWMWICLMILASEVNKSLLVMLLYGFAVVTAFDHILYWFGIIGGRPLIERLGRRWPAISRAMQQAEAAVRGQGIWMITLGRYLPIVGRWVGMGAGLAGVPFLRFALFDAIGTALTVVGFGVVSFYVGLKIMDSPAFPYIIGGSVILGIVFSIVFVAWQGVKVVRHQKSGDDDTPSETTMPPTLNS